LFNPDFTLCDNQYTEYATWGGFGSGKTLVFLLAFYIICMKYKNVNALIIRDTYDQLEDTIIYDFNNLFNGRGYVPKTQKKIVEFPGTNSVIRFRAFDEPGKILGGNIDLIGISQAEQVPKELYNQIFGRLRGSGTVPKKLILTEGNPAECWAKERYKNNKLSPNTFFIESTTFDNKEVLDDINPNYIPNMLNTLTPAQIRRYMYGEWSSYDEMVFSNFNEKLNVIDPFEFPDTYKIIAGGDYGQVNPASFIWACIDYDGRIIIFDEFYERGQSYDELASAGKRYGSVPIVYDYATKMSYEKGKSTWSELEKRGLNLIESNKSELRNISSVNTKFKQNRLFITRNCVNLLREIINYKWQKNKLMTNKNEPEKPVDKDNHAIDAMLYLDAYIEDMKSKDPKALDYTKSLEYHTKKKGDNNWLQRA
jgi:PBSX family phage terminase large subunit